MIERLATELYISHRIIGIKMSGIEIFKPMPLYVSESAAAKVKSLVQEEGNPDLKLRVYVTGGGCSGFQYGFIPSTVCLASHAKAAASTHSGATPSAFVSFKGVGAINSSRRLINAVL